MSDLIVIPAFNEASSIGDIVSRARRHGDVLVVDDGSSDESAAVAGAAGADVVRLGRRRGKGQALQRGFAEALARGADRVITLDGDGQHDPDDLPQLLRAAAEAPDALIIGGRLGTSGADNWTVGRLAALRVAGFFIDWVTRAPVVDTQSGFRVYPASLLAAVTPRHGGFVLETEMLIRAVAAGWRLVEVPIEAVRVTGRVSRFRPLRDGIAVGGYLARQVVRRWGQEALEVAAALGRPFTAERRRPRHRAQAAFVAPYRHNPATWALATGVFALGCIEETWRGWWRDSRGRCLRLTGVATVATPLLLLLAAVHRLHPRGLPALAAFTRRVYSQDRLAGFLSTPRPAARRLAAR
ncbi:MAG: hypothetical protein C5B48_02025, partial [Candidatus Rokuibacteriota bacterium]